MEHECREFRIMLGQQKITVRIGNGNGVWIATAPTPTGRHDHSYYELQLLLKGKFMMEVNDKALALEKKQGILIAPNTYHLSHTFSSEFERVSLKLFLGKGDLKERLKDFAYRCFPVDEEIEDACRSCMAEHEGKEIFQTQMLQAQLTRLMIQVVRKLELFGEDKDLAGRKKLNFRLDQIEEIDSYMNQNYMNKAGMPQLAHRLCISSRQLRRLMEELYGMTFQEKLTSVRMERAGLLLKTTDKSSGEIADSVGYGSESTFYKNFQVYYSMTPGEYRKQMKRK